MSRRLNKHCPDCDKEITDCSTYCKSCAQKGERSSSYKHGQSKFNNNHRRRLDNHCPDCGKDIDDRSTYCKSCARKSERHPNYIDGLGDLPNYSHGRDYIVNYAEWMKDVFERDNYQCQHCGNNKKLRAHHINSFSEYPELRIIVENGITLCEYHHKQLHQLFGNGVTPEQLKWFFNNVK